MSDSLRSRKLLVVVRVASLCSEVSFGQHSENAVFVDQTINQKIGDQYVLQAG